MRFGADKRTRSKVVFYIKHQIPANRHTLDPN